MKSQLLYRGILGLGSNSTNYYLQRIHQKYQEQNQEFSTCPLMLYQIDFQELNPYLPSEFSFLKTTLKNYLNQLSELGISKLLIPNITLHETLDQIESPLEICHAVDLATKYLMENNISKITLFGTLYTMNSDYLKSKLFVKNIEIVLPEKRDQEYIDFFRKEVYNGKATDTQINYFQDLIKKYSENNKVLIACTELSMFSSKNGKHCVDMAELQIEDFLK